MKNLRSLISIIAVVLLVAGYAASQNAYFGGNASAYAAKVDTAPIQTLALILLVVCVGFAFFRDNEADEK